MAKESIGAKIPTEWKQQIIQICSDLDITPSEWLSGVIGQALGDTTVNAVHSLPERVAALEKKLNNLSVLLSR